MTITTFAITSTVTIIFGLIIYAVIRHFSKDLSKEDSDQNPIEESPLALFCTIDKLKKIEPIKSHIDSRDEAERTRDALHDSIIRNLLDNGFIPRVKGLLAVDMRWLLEEGSTRLQTVLKRFQLPDLLELQNTLKLKPIIKDLEDQYKRYEEAVNRAEAEQKLLHKVFIRLREMAEKAKDFEALVRDINEALEEAKESLAKESQAKES